MALPHATSGEVISLPPLGSALPQARTITLVKSDTLELLRVVVPAGKEIPPHQVAGDITIHCLEGVLEVDLDNETRTVRAGELLYLQGNQSHALRGIENSTALVTILLR